MSTGLNFLYKVGEEQKVAVFRQTAANFRQVTKISIMLINFIKLKDSSNKFGTLKKNFQTRKFFSPIQNLGRGCNCPPSDVSPSPTTTPLHQKICQEPLTIHLILQFYKYRQNIVAGCSVYPIWPNLSGSCVGTTVTKDPSFRPYSTVSA